MLHDLLLKNTFIYAVYIMMLYLVHYNNVIMSAMASQITSVAIVYSTVYSSADQRKHQSAASLAFVWGIHRWPVNSPHKEPVTRKMFPFDDVIMWTLNSQYREKLLSRPRNTSHKSMFVAYTLKGLIKWHYYRCLRVSFHRPFGCLLKSLFRIKTKMI